MQDVILENPAYRRWNFVESNLRQNWIKSISIGDDAVASHQNGDIRAGRVEMINNYGLEISTACGYKYYRFANIMKVIKRNTN